MEGSLLGEADAHVQADRDTLTQKNIEWIRTKDDVRPRGESVIVAESGENVSALALFEEAETKAVEEEEAEQGKVTLVFVAFCFLEITANFDAGVLPACVGEVMVEFDLDYTVAGFLGALVYVGMVIGTPVAGYQLTNTTFQNRLIAGAAALNSLSTLMFAFADTHTTLYIGRTLMGVSQGCIFVYAPVWVDEFSPAAAQGIWMAGLQGAVVLGIVAGYVTTGLFVTKWLPMVCPAEDDALIEEGIIDTDRASIDLSALTKEQRQELSMNGKNFSALASTGVEEFDTEEDFGCYNPRWKYALCIQAACMASFVVLFLVLPVRWTNAKGGLAERLRARRNVLYREMIAALKPQNIDSMAQMEIEKQLTPGKVLSKMKHSVATSTLVTTTREAYELSVLQDPGTRSAIARVAQLRSPRGASLEESPYAIDESDLESEVPEPAEGDLLSGVAIDNTNRLVGVMELFAVQPSSSNSNGNGVGGGSRVGQQLKQLFSSQLWVALTLSLCSVYFVVTGVQFWITDYATLAKEEGGLGADAQTVVFVFSVASVTGPVIGVFLGGVLIDKQGGYKDDPNSSELPGAAAHRTLRTCGVFAIGAVLASIPAAFSNDFNTVMVALWLVLLFGGAIVSPATGVCINAVQPQLRSFGSAIAMFLYNLLGYAAAPLIGGAVAEVSSLKWGYRSCILAVGMATAFMVLSISIAKGMIGEDESSEAVLELPAAVNTNASGTSSEHSADTSSPVASDGVEPSGPPPSVPESAPKIDGDGSEPVGPPPALIEPDGDITAL
jgi:MFS family permease